MQRYEQSVANGIVRVKVIGPIDFGESMQFIRENLPSWKGMPILWDFSQAEMHHWSVDALANHIKQSGASSQPPELGKMAFYSSNPLHHSMLELIRSLRNVRGNGSEAKVFKSIDAALEWLRAEKS